MDVTPLVIEPVNSVRDDKRGNDADDGNARCTKELLLYIVVNSVEIEDFLVEFINLCRRDLYIIDI